METKDKRHLIDFSHIEDRNWLYEFLYPYVRYAHDKAYYRQLFVTGRENLPVAGVPYMMLSNHQNGLNDAMLMLTSQDDPTRRPVFIARADIFNNPVIGIIMRFLRILPAFRVRDTGREHVGDNNIIFARAADILAKGGVVGMFPEALAHRDHDLKPLKKGFARIAFDAAERNDKLVLMPVCNWYGEYEHPNGVAGIWYGKPVHFEDLMPLYREQPAHAYGELCERMHAAITALEAERDQWVETHQTDIARQRKGGGLLWVLKLLGLLLNLLPLAIIEGVVSLVVKNPILKGSTRMALGIFMLAPLLWLIISLAAGALFGWWWFPVALLAQPLGMRWWCLT